MSLMDELENSKSPERPGRTIYLLEDEWERLKRVAKTEGVKQNALVASLVKLGLDEYEKSKRSNKGSSK